MNSKYILFKNDIPIYTVPIMKLIIPFDQDLFSVRPNEEAMLQLFEVMLRADAERLDHCDYKTFWTVGFPVENWPNH